jgi:hypothetical protein
MATWGALRLLPCLQCGRGFGATTPQAHDYVLVNVGVRVCKHHCRCSRSKIARAVLSVNPTTAVIHARKGNQEHRISAPVAILQLYSSMLHDMAADGVFDPPEDGAPRPPQALPANPRHDPEAVGAALRWTMGLSTMLPLDVYMCVKVLEYVHLYVLTCGMSQFVSTLCAAMRAPSTPHPPPCSARHGGQFDAVVGVHASRQSVSAISI